MGDGREATAVVGELRRLDPERVATPDMIRLASHRSKPVADLGLALLKRRTFTESDATSLLALTQADCETARPELIRWLRDTLTGIQRGTFADTHGWMARLG